MWSKSLLFALMALVLFSNARHSTAVESDEEGLVIVSQLQPATAQPTQDRTFLLPSDVRHTLWIPRDFQHQDKTIDVLFDFHGSPSRVRSSTRFAGLNCVVISVKYAGLSSVYRVPFSEDRQLFATILNESLEALHAEPDFPQDVQWGRMVVTSFSAGFGAVREILKSQEYVDRINGIYMVDSLYCGYVGDGTDVVEDGVVHPGLMKDFLRFARQATKGKKVMIITHCMEPTPGYASTRETADYLLDKLDLEPKPVEIVVEPTCNSDAQIAKLHLYRKAARKGFSLYGSSGLGATDHVAHMQNMAYWLSKLPIAKREAHRKAP